MLREIRDCRSAVQVDEYNVPHGKRNRGLSVVSSYRYIVGDGVTEEGLKLAGVVGWCVEWVSTNLGLVVRFLTNLFCYFY